VAVGRPAGQRAAGAVDVAAAAGVHSVADVGQREAVAHFVVADDGQLEAGRCSAAADSEPRAVGISCVAGVGMVVASVPLVGAAALVALGVVGAAESVAVADFGYGAVVRCFELVHGRAELAKLARHSAYCTVHKPQLQVAGND